MFDYLFIIILLCSYLFPIAYAYVKKINSKLVFCCICYGAQQIFTVFCLIAVAPLVVLDIFIFPQIAAAGLADYLAPYFVISNFIGENWYLLSVVILFILPSLIIRGYGNIFNAKNT